VLRRSAGDHTEFVTLTFWDSLDAVRAFAGDNYERAVYYPKDTAYLLDLQPTIKHYEVIPVP
jgi:heme-degrading monooxygenase HmoA